LGVYFWWQERGKIKRKAAKKDFLKKENKKENIVT
jgi:hypothetical protein